MIYQDNDDSRESHSRLALSGERGICDEVAEVVGNGEECESHDDGRNVPHDAQRGQNVHHLVRLHKNPQNAHEKSDPGKYGPVLWRRLQIGGEKDEDGQNRPGQYRHRPSRETGTFRQIQNLVLAQHALAANDFRLFWTFKLFTTKIWLLVGVEENVNLKLNLFTYLSYRTSKMIALMNFN